MVHLPGLTDAPRRISYAFFQEGASSNVARRLFILGLVLVPSLLAPHDLRAQVPDASFAEIAQKSDLIFVGTVEALESQFNENETLITTQATLAESQVIHSEEAEQSGEGPIEMNYVGGQVDSLQLSVSGAPTVEPGERYVFFKRDDGEQYINPIVGRGRGMFQVLQDSETGTAYVLTSTGQAVLDVSAERVISSDRVVRDIENGDVVWAEDTTESFTYSELPSPGDEADGVESHESESPTTGVPITLDSFINFIQEEALSVAVDDPVLRLEGQGSMWEREGEEIVQNPIPTPKVLGAADAKQSTNDPEPKGQNLRVCGFQNLKINMEHYSPLKRWNNQAMGIWDRL